MDKGDFWWLGSIAQIQGIEGLRGGLANFKGIGCHGCHLPPFPHYFNPPPSKSSLRILFYTYLSPTFDKFTQLFQFVSNLSPTLSPCESHDFLSLPFHMAGHHMPQTLPKQLISFSNSFYTLSPPNNLNTFNFSFILSHFWPYKFLPFHKLL